MDATSRPNVFVLTVDSLRADAFTETMEAVSETIGGVRYTNAVSTANATGSSMPALAAGVYADTVQRATGTLKLGESSEEDGFVTMAEVLSAAEFDCSLWSENTIFGAARNYQRGFTAGKAGTPSVKRRLQSRIQSVGSDRLFNTARWLYFNVLARIESAATEATYYGPARDLHASVLDSLGERRTGGEMHWLHYMDTHHPFDPPAEYLERRSFNTPRSRTQLSELSSKAIITNRGAGVTDADVADIEEAYLACCTYLRDQLLEFIAALKEREHFVPGRDVLVLTADHGEGFSPDEHDMLGHTPTPAFWEDLVRVPLVISHPEWSSRKIDRQVSLIDVMPTVLAAAGATVPEAAEGRIARAPDDMTREYALFSSVGPERVYHGIRADSGWKLFADRINTVDSVELTGTDRAHDRERVLLTAYDADETAETVWFERDLEDADVRPSDDLPREIYDELSGELDRRTGGFSREKERETTTEEMERQLRDLGYLDDVPNRAE